MSKVQDTENAIAVADADAKGGSHDVPPMLRLRREVMRTLTNAELGAVAGGGASRINPSPPAFN